MAQSVLEAIYQRRSIREYSDEPVSVEDLHEIIKAGIWAPSGLNNQPWRFVIIAEPSVMEELSRTTRYSHIVRAAPALIAVFVDREAMYNEVKDHQAAGACLQNMLLAAEALGLGAVWLGEILNSKEEVNRILAVDDRYDLMAVVAVGHPAHKNQQSTRKDLDQFILKSS